MTLCCFDETGTLIASDSDNSWRGKAFYSFLIEEVFVYEPNHTVAGISDELYAGFKEAAEQNGVIIPYTETILPASAITEVPDPSASISGIYGYGYTDADMLPLSKERAMELLERDIPVYALYPDNSEAMVLDTEDIANHDGLFGITREDWDELKPDVSVQGGILAKKQESVVSCDSKELKPSVLEQLKAKESQPKTQKTPKKTKENER